jgi:hypothetical protein
MNGLGRMRWRAVVPALVAAAAMAAAALPVAAQAASGPVPGTKFPVFRSVPGLAGGRAAPQLAAVPPKLGAAPAVAATGGATTPVVFAYTGSDSRVYAAPLATPPHLVSFGGRLIGGPGLAFVPAPIGPGFVGPFGRGVDNRLWLFDHFTSGGVPVWRPFGGVLTSRPGVAAGALSVPGGEAIDVVVRGADGGTWLRESTSTALSAWRNLGGKVLAGSGPAAVNVGGTVYVLVLGTNRAVYVKHSTDGRNWSGWARLGGLASGDVGAANPAPGVGVVFVRGADNALWYNEFAGTTPGVTRGWHKLGGILTSGAGAGSAPNGTTWALVQGVNNHIWQRAGIWPHLGGWRKVL